MTEIIEDCECKTIKGFEDYLIYKNGTVFSKKRKIFLKPRRAGRDRDYLYVHLRDRNSGEKYLSIHRLVAIHFIREPKENEQVDHIDNNKSNNNLENLQWVTPRENIRKGHADGLLRPPPPAGAGEKNHQAKLNRDFVWLIRKVYSENNKTNKEFWSYKKLAKAFSVHQSTIQGIIACKNWK